MRRALIILLMAFCILYHKNAHAQLFPRTINFTKEIYKAHNQNWMIAQSPDNKMYFGNTEGLLEYDGLNWNLFQLPHHQAIRSVVSDENGKIFTGSFGDFGYWETDEKGDLVYHSLIDSSFQENARKEEIWNIVIHDGYVLFQSFSSIFVYDYQRVRILQPPGNIMFIFEVGGELFVQVIDNGIFRFTPSGNFNLLPSTLSLSDKKVLNIMPFGSDGFLVATASNGLYLYNEGRFSPWGNDAQQAFKDFQLNKGIALSNGQFALGTILDGVYVLDNQGKLKTRINQKAALQNNTVLALFEDNMQSLWCGLDKGIDLVEMTAPVKYFIDKTGVEGTVYAACKFKGNLYLGTNQGLFIKSWEAVNDFSSNKAFEIIEGSQGQVWDLKVFDGQLICGQNEGSFLVDGKKLEKISNVTGGFATIEYPADRNYLLQGTYTGIVVLTKNDRNKWAFSHRIEGFMEPVKRLRVDKDGYLWGANPIKGLHRFTLSKDLKSFTSIKSFSEADGLPDNFNVDITPYNGMLLFNLDDKYYHFNQQKAHFESYDTPPFEEDGFKLLQFEKDRFFRVFKNRVEFTEGKNVKEFNLTLVSGYERIIEIDPEVYLFCLDDGFAILNQDQMDVQVTIPPPAIDLVEAFGKRGKKIVPGAISKPVEFAANENDLRFNFYQPVFNQKPELSYQLEGYDPDWHDCEGRSLKEFTNLPAGDYVFKIRSLQSMEEDVFSFSIHQKWYKSQWMLLVYLGLVSFFGIVFYQMHLKRLKKERQVFEAESERALREQEIKSNNEKLSLEVVSKSKALANSTMGLIRKNEILQQVKNELIQIRKENTSRFHGKDFKKMVNLIDVHITSEQDWEIFETNFNKVHEHFFKKLKTEFPELTPGDLKLAAYLKMNLSSKEIAPLLNISLRGVENKRYRLRTKIDLQAPKNLTEFMIEY
jgi:hypothetical protein